MLGPCTLYANPPSLIVLSFPCLAIIQVRAFIVAHGRALDDDGFKFVLRYYVGRVQALVASLGKKSSVWQEAFDKYVSV